MRPGTCESICENLNLRKHLIAFCNNYFHKKRIFTLRHFETATTRKQYFLYFHVCFPVPDPQTFHSIPLNVSGVGENVSLEGLLGA